MKIVVGLGNIGEKYTLNRHNAGFIVLDNFLESLNLPETPSWKEESKLKCLSIKVPYSDHLLFLAKPTTLMNNSGQAVTSILSFFKEPVENLVVIYDDIDLPLGKVRMRESGSAGTHNGMRSVIQELNSENFHRIRIGIESRGEQTHKNIDISNFVLSDFTKQEVPLLKDSVDQAIQELKNLLTKDNN